MYRLLSAHHWTMLSMLAPRLFLAVVKTVVSTLLLSVGCRKHHSKCSLTALKP